MTVTYDAKMRAKAKAEGLALITIDLDGRPAKTFGRMTVQHPVTLEEFAKVRDFAVALIRERNK